MKNACITVSDRRQENWISTAACAWDPLCRKLAEGIADVNQKIEVIHFDYLQELLGKLPQLVRKDDTILVKASHFMHFEKSWRS